MTIQNQLRSHIAIFILLETRIKAHQIFIICTRRVKNQPEAREAFIAEPLFNPDRLSSALNTPKMRVMNAHSERRGTQASLKRISRSATALESEVEKLREELNMKDWNAQQRKQLVGVFYFPNQAPRLRIPKRKGSWPNAGPISDIWEYAEAMGRTRNRRAPIISHIWACEWIDWNY